MWYDELFHVVGFDILAVGLVVIFGFCVARSLWSDPNPAINPVVQAARCFKGTMSHCAVKHLGTSVTFLLIAAVSGMVLNLVADRALDMDWVHSVRLPYPDWNPDTGGVCWKDDWAPEDGIKLEAYNKVGRILGIQGKNEWGQPGYKAAEGRVKEGFQRAYLVAQAGGAGAPDGSEAGQPPHRQDKIQDTLAREEFFVKLFRVMLAVVLIVAAVSFATAFPFVHGLPTALLIVSSSLFWRLGATLCGGWPLVLFFVPGLFLVSLARLRTLKGSSEEVGKEPPATDWQYFSISVAASLVGVGLFGSGGVLKVIVLGASACVLAGSLRLAWVKSPPSHDQIRVWLVRVCSGVLATLLVVAFFFLWSAQSKRYYKKVFHAYLVVDTKGANQLFSGMPSCDAEPRDKKSERDDDQSRQ